MQSLRTLLRRQIAAAWRHRWIAVLFAWVVCIGGWIAVNRIPNQYEASARLYVDADQVLTPLLRGIAIDDQVSAQLDTLQRTLLSRPNLEKLISKTDLELQITGPSDLERMTFQLSYDIKVIPATRNLFSIYYRNQSPKLAYDVVQTILTTFIESKSGSNRSDIENARVFLQKQIDSYERQLREAERTRAEFRTKYVDLLPSDSGTSKLEGAQGAVRQLQGQLVDASAKREQLTQELKDAPPMVVTETDPGGFTGGGGGGCLRAAQREIDELSARFTDAAPEMIAARTRLATLKRIGCGEEGAGPVRVAPRSRSAPNPLYERLKVELVDNNQYIASLNRQIGDAQKERDRLEDIARGAPGLQAEYLNMNRDYDVLRRNYEELLARRESMRIGAAADADADKVKTRIVDPPQVPQNPIAPKRILLMTGVLLAGLGGGMALAVLLVQLDRSFHTVDDLRDFGLPVVGGISALAINVSFWRGFLATATVATAVLLLCAVYGGLVLQMLRSTGSA